MTPTSVYNGKSASPTATHADTRKRQERTVRAITVAAMAAAMLVTLTVSRAQEPPEKSSDAAQVTVLVAGDGSEFSHVLLRAVTADTVAVENTATAQSTASQEISRDDLARRLQDGSRDFTLIDVRTAEEFAQGHVPSAINIPLDQLAARTSELGADHEI